MLETAAHGTVRALVSYGRRELVQDRGGGKVGMLDASPTLVIETAAAPDLGDGDAVLVGGRLSFIRTPLDNGRGRTNADLEDAQASRAEWQDAQGAHRHAKVFFAGATDPGGRLNVRAGGYLAGLTQDPVMSGFPAGTTFETDDDGAGFEVLGATPWADGWSRLSLRRVA